MCWPVLWVEQFFHSPTGLRAVYRDFTFNIYHNLSQGRRNLEEDKESFNNARHSVASVEPELKCRIYTSVWLQFILIHVQCTLLHRAVLVIAPYSARYCTVQRALLHRTMRVIAPCSARYCTVQCALLHRTVRVIAPCSARYCTVQCTLLHRVVRVIAPYSARYCTVQWTFLHRITL